mmetsp:Transcript_13827/g.39834  ORF Transcript_13827/g.39834 Transcript_13827/m.39834 type:complete len:212 (-) Transcript_13827:493-1128(-)
MPHPPPSGRTVGTLAASPPRNASPAHLCRVARHRSRISRRRIRPRLATPWRPSTRLCSNSSNVRNRRSLCGLLSMASLRRPPTSSPSHTSRWRHPLPRPLTSCPPSPSHEAPKRQATWPRRRPRPLSSTTTTSSSSSGARAWCRWRVLRFTPAAVVRQWVPTSPSPRAAPSLASRFTRLAGRGISSSRPPYPERADVCAWSTGPKGSIFGT